MSKGNWWAHSTLSWWMNQSYTARWAFITHTFIRNNSLTLILQCDHLHCFKRIVHPKMKMPLSFINARVITKPFLLGSIKGHILKNVLITLFFCNETRLSSIRFAIKNDWFFCHHGCQKEKELWQINYKVTKKKYANWIECVAYLYSSVL